MMLKTTIDGSRTETPRQDSRRRHLRPSFSQTSYSDNRPHFLVIIFPHFNFPHQREMRRLRRLDALSGPPVVRFCFGRHRAAPCPPALSRHLSRMPRGTTVCNKAESPAPLAERCQQRFSASQSCWSAEHIFHRERKTVGGATRLQLELVDRGRLVCFLNGRLVGRFCCLWL